MPHDLWHEFTSYPALFRKLMKVRSVVKPERVSFGENKAQYFLHFAPEGEPRDKVVVYIHGGGWNSGNPSQFAFIGQRFAQLGYHCVLLGYRRSPIHRFPAQIMDVCAGYCKALEYLDKNNVDTGKMLITGSSAGGHLGALLCCDQELQRRFGIDPARLCGFAGLAGAYRFDCPHTRILRGMLWELFSPRYDRAQAAPYQKLSSEQKTPMLIVHSQRDGIVRYQSAVDFYERAAALGIPAELYIAPPPMDSHSAYSTGIFLEERQECATLDKLLGWIEER